MVKKENANFSIPDSWTGAGPRSEPEAPPGFRPQPPKTCTSAAAESSRNENPTSKEKGFRRVYRKRSTSSGQQSPRRTSRKRSRPQFYAPSPAQPPPATPRRRGRPPKARSMSQLSHQETETRKPNQVTSTPSERPQEQTSCLIRSFSQLIQESQSCHNLVGKKTNMKRTNRDVAVNKNQAGDAQKSTFRTHDIDETLFDISLTEVSDPISGYRRVGNVSRNDQTSQGIDPKILQHVANALQYMAGSQTAVDETKVKSKSSDINENLAHTLKAINKKHGDITQDSLLESDCMKTLVLLGICKVVQDLQRKHLKDLDISTLDSYYTAVRDAENMKVNVQWLHNRLDEIKDAVKFTAEAKVLVNEKNRRLEDIDSKKKELLLREGELERLKSEIQDIEEQVAREVVLVEELNKKIGAQTSRFSKFQHTQLMDGLI
ncbi:hypothetical protein DH2020_036226 [Rehmannia glutinosa]|uniref:Uncharacterized protein n=1 Tax=Rehmannia glutinosa TaxID=99300 RepID=A0ABR0V4P5_REHGL